MANEWLGGSIGKSSHASKQKWGRGYKDEYFDGNNLKDGYETRFLGNGDNVSEQGAVAVYTNDYDDMWDSYDPMRDKANYGIFKKPQQAAAPAPTPAPRPAPKAAPAAKPKPVQLSKEVATAIGRSQAYQDTAMIRDGDYVIGGDESVISDFNQQTEQNIKEASKPYFEDDVDPKVAQSYADKYKFVLGDGFKLTKQV